MTDDLMQFLRARFGEREAQARAAHDEWAVADAQSKLGVLRQYETAREQVRNPVSAENRMRARVAQGELEDVLRLLALPYMNHPDYRDQWNL
jgi:hypothetical protein